MHVDSLEFHGLDRRPAELHVCDGCSSAMRQCNSKSTRLKSVDEYYFLSFFYHAPYPV